MLGRRLAQCAAIATIGFSLGIYFGDWAGPRLFRLLAEPEAAVLYQQTIHVPYQRFMRPVVFGAVLSAAWWLWSLRSELRSLQFAAVAALLTCASVIAVITLTVNVPLNNQLMTWDPAAPPADFAARWAPWDTANTARVILATVALTLALSAALFLGKAPADPKH